MEIYRLLGVVLGLKGIFYIWNKLWRMQGSLNIIDMEKELISNYCEAAKIQMDAIHSGDYKKGNKASDKLKKYNDLMRSDFLKYESIVKELLNSEEPNAVIFKLKKMTENEELGILRLNAKMTLKVHNLW